MRIIFKTAGPGKIFLGILLGFLVAGRVYGSIPYLALVGPAPLRFEFIATNNTLFLSKLTLPKPVATNAPVIPMPTPTAETNQAKNTTGLDASGLFGTGNGLPDSGSAAKNATRSPDSASELLGITPQMIDNYFKPIQADDGSTSHFQPGQVIFVPAEWGFVPPMPGSRAIYISK